MKNMDFRTNVIKAKEILLSSPNNISMYEIFASEANTFKPFRVLHANSNDGSALQSKLSKNSTTAITKPIFCESKLLAYSEQIRKQMLLGEHNILYKSQAMLDTNFLSDLPRYFTGQDLSTREVIKETLKVIITDFNSGVDWTFASLENMREAMKAGNPWPTLKVAAVKYFLENGNKVVTGEEPSSLFKPYIRESCQFWDEWISDEDCLRQLQRRDLLYCVMLLTFKELWNSTPLDETLNIITEFCLKVFNTLPLKEIYFAWKAFTLKTENKLSIFDETALKNNKINSIKRIRALSWDLFIFRWTETSLSLCNDNEFFIPCITTIDAGLNDMVKNCPLKAVIMSLDGNYIESIFEDEIDFANILEGSLTNKVRTLINCPNRTPKSYGVDALNTSISNFEKEISSLIG